MSVVITARASPQTGGMGTAYRTACTHLFASHTYLQVDKTWKLTSVMAPSGSHGIMWICYGLINIIRISIEVISHQM